MYTRFHKSGISQWLGRAVLAGVLVAGLPAAALARAADDEPRGREILRQQFRQQEQQKEQARDERRDDRGSGQQEPRQGPPAQPAAQQAPGAPQRQYAVPRRDGNAGNSAGNNGRSDGAPGTDRGQARNRARDYAREVARDGRNYQRPPRQVVPSLPYGYARHNWGGRPYYYQGGHWYRPYGSSFAIVAAPYGLFVPYLPGYYNSLWVGSTRYYYADDTYYTYEPARRGYVVSRSPYNDDRDDEDYDDNAGDEDLYIYPSRGQSEQQQADDRYECHRWAVEQTHYDPVDSGSDAGDRASYLRAMTACLTGRGYSVR
jgi:hypothetical protein